MNNEHKRTWDRMTPEQRLGMIRKDPSMRDARWKLLSERWSQMAWSEMNSIQQDGVSELFRMYGVPKL